MTTPNTKNQNRKNPAEQVVFVEYSTAEKGQHFMTVMGKENGRRKIVARIFKEFDTVEKKFRYTAKDREGQEMFSDFNLYAMKKSFIDHAKGKAKEIIPSPSSVPTVGEEQHHKNVVIENESRTSEEFGKAPKQKKEIVSKKEIKRESELKDLREEKENGKEKEISR